MNGWIRKEQNMKVLIRKPVILAIVLALMAGHTSAQGFFRRATDVTLAENGRAASVIVVPEGMLAWEGDDARIPGWGRDPERWNPEIQRRLQRDSALDLAHYLGKMTGAEFEIVTSLPEGDDRTPIYIGAAAEEVFGPVGIHKPTSLPLVGDFGFRVVADPRRGIGLYGESEWGVSYAIYELLHRLGCRWYMPSELGEVIPETPTLKVAAMDEKLAPATEYRNINARNADSDFLRRNRLTAEGLRFGIRDQHSLPLDLAYWCPDEAKRVADDILERLENNYSMSVSLSGHDGVYPTEHPEGRKHDPEPRVWEAAAGRWSVTDRLYMFANRVAEQVGEKHPEVLFGLLAYVNANLPPAREPVHPNVIPSLAPIDFNRHHPMTWEDHPNEFWLKDMVEGWAAKADRLAYYAYGMNLAELSAPCPFITKWGTDIPILMKNNVVWWRPETMAGWESMMPGYYLSIRLTFYPDEKPEEILNEMWDKFYGAASEPMGRWWHTIDRAWIEAREYSGNCFGYLRMFTPEVMAEARALLDEALEKCETRTEYRRVYLIHETFGLFELFMRMREDLAAGRLANLGDDYERWRESLRHLFFKYRPQYVLGFPHHHPGGMAEDYMNRFIYLVYSSASRMESEYRRHGEPMLEWKWKHNPGPEEDALPWTALDYDDADWPVKHVVRDTWSTIGHHNTLTDVPSGRSGRMAYRATQRLRALPEGKRAILWLGSTDGTAKLFVNGRHVPYVGHVATRRIEEGKTYDAFPGPYCQPGKFDVTDALVVGENQITILTERHHLNELGTGGIMGPVVIYRER